MKNKFRLFLSYNCLIWVFTLCAIILESVALALYLNKWSGQVWILYTISAFGFVFVGCAISMLICLQLDKRLKLNDEKKGGETKEDNK